MTTVALGDWQVNEEKLECSLGELVREGYNRYGIKIRTLGGTGDGFKKTVICTENIRTGPFRFRGKNRCESRNQLVLDFSEKKRWTLFMIRLQKCWIMQRFEYLKWDMNRRTVADVYSMTAAGYQGNVLYDYVLGVYDFLDRLTKRYPNLLIEGCSGEWRKV
ncbi:MAG: alpha-galactosidase [Coprococcus sp.]